MKKTAFFIDISLRAQQPALGFFEPRFLPGGLISAGNDDHKLAFHVVLIFSQPGLGHCQCATKMLLKFLSKFSPKKT